MHRPWWKAYFVLALTLTIAGLVVPFFIDESPSLAWWEWVYIPLYLVQLAGLFGFVFLRRIASPLFWKLVFFASILYEIWELSSSAMELQTYSHVLGVAGLVGLIALVQLPMLIALCLYAYRFQELWHGAT